MKFNIFQLIIQITAASNALDWFQNRFCNDQTCGKCAKVLIYDHSNENVRRLCTTVWAQNSCCASKGLLLNRIR